MPRVQQPPVLVLGSENRTTLAVARSLGACGRPFVVISTQNRGMVSASRLVRHHVRAPDPDEDVGGFIACVLGLSRSTGADIAIPCDDATLAAGSRYRDRLLAEGVVLAAASAGAIENVLTKRANLATAARLGIPLPDQYDIQSAAEIPELVEALGFPIVLKPAHAASGDTPGSRFPFKWLVARNEQELRDAIGKYCTEGEFPLFQELLRGSVVGLYCFAVRGRLVAVHGARAERRALGQHVLRTIIPVDPVLEGYARAMIAELEWDGPASLAFFVAADGRVSYLETNGRFWGSTQGSVDAGWDIPGWSVDYFREGRIPDPPAIALGSRACWRAQDLLGLICVLRGQAWLTDRDEVPATTAIRDYVASFRPGIRADVFRRDDPLPELVEHAGVLTPVVGRAARRLKRGVNP